MALVRSNRKGVNSALAALGSVIAAALNTSPDVYRNAWEVGRAGGTFLKGSSGSNDVPFTQPQGGGGNAPRGSGRSGKTRKRGRGKERKQNSRNSDTFRTIGLGPVTTVPTIRTRMTGVLPLATNASSIFSLIYGVSYENAGTLSLLSYLSPDSLKLLGAFEKALVHSVVVRYIGTVASTAPGYLGIGFDSSTQGGIPAPTSIADLAGKNQNLVICDIKGDATLRYEPKGTDREIRLLDTTAPTSEKLAGLFSMYLGGHTLAASTNFGILQMTVDITLLQ